MSALENVNYFIGLFLSTFRQFGRARVWLILIGYFLLQWLVLFAHYQFYSPVFHGLISAWTSLVSGQLAMGFEHYPGQFLLMPYFAGWAKLAVGVVFEGAVLGAVALLLYDRITGYEREEGEGRPTWWFNWSQATLAWVVLNGLVLAANLVLPELLSSFLHGSPRRILVFEIAILPATYLLFFVLLYYAIPYCVLYRVNAFRAIIESIRLTLTSPITTFFLALIILSGPIAVSVIAGKSDVIVDKFAPELVYWVLLAGLVVDIFVSFFWMGTSVRHLIEQE